MKILIILCLILSSCSHKPVRQIIIEPIIEDSIKTVTVIDKGDTVQFNAEIVIPDSVILAEIKFSADSLKRVEYIQDSINFRTITKKINGGYNGFDDRFQLWIRALDILNLDNQ